MQSDDAVRSAAVSWPEREMDTLAAAARAGQRAALERLLVTVRPFLTRYCRARLQRPGGSCEVADRVAREACLAALGALPHHRQTSLLALVYRIAVEAVDAHLAEPGRARPAPPGRLPDRLAPVHREILVLRAVVGLSSEQTARAMGSTPNAVRAVQHRALNALRTAVPELG